MHQVMFLYSNKKTCSEISGLKTLIGNLSTLQLSPQIRSLSDVPISMG